MTQTAGWGMWLNTEASLQSTQICTVSGFRAISWMLNQSELDAFGLFGVFFSVRSHNALDWINLKNALWNFAEGGVGWEGVTRVQFNSCVCKCTLNHHSTKWNITDHKWGILSADQWSTGVRPSILITGLCHTQRGSNQLSFSGCNCVQHMSF